MARIFLIIESRIIGRRFAGAPCFFPGFGRGVSIPDLISAGHLPVLAMVFSSVAIPCVFLEVHTLYILHLVHLLVLMRLDAFSMPCYAVPLN